MRFGSVGQAWWVMVGRWVTARSVGAVTVRSGLFGYAWLGLVRRSCFGAFWFGRSGMVGHGRAV